MASEIEELRERLATLERERDERLEREAVLATLLAYSRCIDLGDEAGWVDCFTLDGAFDMRSPIPGYPSERVVGRPALARFIAAHTGPPQVHHKHIYLMPEIRVAGPAAEASGYVVHLVEDGGRPELQAFGRYFDTLTKGGEDRWRLVERIVEVEATTGSQK